MIRTGHLFLVDSLNTSLIHGIRDEFINGACFRPRLQMQFDDVRSFCVSNLVKV